MSTGYGTPYGTPDAAPPVVRQATRPRAKRSGRRGPSVGQADGADAWSPLVAAFRACRRGNPQHPPRRPFSCAPADLASGAGRAGADEYGRERKAGWEMSIPPSRPFRRAWSAARMVRAGRATQNPADGRSAGPLHPSGGMAGGVYHDATGA